MNSKERRRKGIWEGLKQKIRRVILCDYIIVSKIKRNFRKKARDHGRDNSQLSLQIQVCGLANTEKRKEPG